MESTQAEVQLTEEDLTLFYDVSNSIHVIQDLDEMLQNILLGIEKVFRVEGASLALHDPERSEFFFIRTVEEEKDGDHDRKMKMRFPDHLGVAGWVLRERRPALIPDVAIVHVQRCDKHGNSQIWGIVGEQKEAAFASKHVIITAEEIVEEDIIRSDPNRTVIPSIIVDAVCHVPFAAHPSYTQGYYDRDNLLYIAWDEIIQSTEKIQNWLDEWVYGVKDRDEYWKKLGEDTHNRLKVSPRMSSPIDYGDY